MAPARDRLPASLTRTGCFDASDASIEGPALVDFNVAMPLWADKAGKHRLFAIPAGSAIRVEGDDLVFPIGSVVTKTFFRDTRRIETRLLVRHDDGEWAGYAYEWNDAQNDAFLLEEGKDLERWRIPSRKECMSCHTAAAGFTLGPELAQMNSDQTYPRTGRIANQLVTLAEVGMLEGLPDTLPPSFPRLMDKSDATAWARAYLHVNCSQCHRPGGPKDAAGDLRATTPLASTGMCGVDPAHGDLGVANAKLIAPGAPERSLMTLTMRELGQKRMPPLATRVVDEEAIATIDAWIAGLSGCGAP